MSPQEHAERLLHCPHPNRNGFPGCQYIRGQRRHSFPLENSVVNGGSKSLTPRKPNRPNQRALQIRLNLAPNKVSPPFYLYPGNQTLSILTCEKGSVQENNPLRR